MKTGTLLLACALVALSGAAWAGPCTTEIENVTKLLASRDAGAGPTAGGSAATGHPPTAAMGGADPSTSASSAAAEFNSPAASPDGSHEPSDPRQRPIFASGRHRT